MCVCVIREVAHEWPHVSGPRRTGSVLQLQLAFVPDTVPLSSLRLSPRCLSASLPLSLAGSSGIKARLSDSIGYFSWAPNGSVSVKQALFSPALIGSKIISLSTARLRFLIITPLMFSHVLMHRGADGVRACAAYCTCNHSCVFVSMCGRALSNAGTPSRCSPGSHGSTRCPPCSRLLPSRQPSAPRRSSAGRCCRGRCQNSLRYGSS